MPKKPAENPAEKRPTPLTVILKTPEDVAVKDDLEMLLLKGKAAGLYARDTTLSEFCLLLLRAQMKASTTVRKPRK